MARSSRISPMPLGLALGLGCALAGLRCGGDDGGDPLARCGNGVLDPGEVCDDGNRVTETAPLPSGACMADCSMRLDTCGDGKLDPGEQCDDPRAVELGDCTASCTLNDRSVHAPCTRSTGNAALDVSGGEITGCEQVPASPGFAVGCVLSYDFFGQTQVYAAEGECQLIATQSTVLNVGDYELATSCPGDLVFVEKVVTSTVTVRSRVCQKPCESDADCRWNTYDDYWMGPGEYRCTTTPVSGGRKVCTDPRNDAL